MRPNQILATIIAASSLTAAWPWPPNFGKVRDSVRSVEKVVIVERAVEGVENLLYGRADSSSATDSAAATSASAKATGTSDTSAAKETDASTDSAASNSGSNTGTSATGTGKTTAKTTGKTTTTTGSDSSSNGTSTSINNEDPSGGVSMLTPAATATSSYYKIGDWVSFKWNYTSLQVTPSAVNVIASCSLNSATYTIANNMSVEETGLVYWDTSNDATRLVQETYTLIVYNAAHAVTQTASAGYFGYADAFTFAMYQPQTYTPRSEWTCVACNAAMSSTEKQTLKFLFGMMGITVASFTWFVVGFGVL